MQQIADWLNRLGLGQYAQRFADSDIDPSVLRDLTDQDLEKIGVSLGHRKRILRAISELDEGGSAPEPSRWIEAERRQLTVMFADLVGSTALSTRLDPEELRDVIGGYHRCCTDVISKCGGFVARYMGDGILAYFGYPQAHEEDTERAVRAGLALVAAVAKLRDGAETALRVRIGIATGLVIVGDLRGDGAGPEHEVLGETPNLAARLQALAEPNEVVIDCGTRRLVGELFECRALGPVAVKGFADPVPVWQVIGPSAVDGRFEALRRATTPLVGRDEEIELLMRCYQRAKSGKGCVVLVSGEPGIGKSRIAQTVLERLRGEPHTPLRLFCSPHHQDSALYPIITQLERAAGFRRDDADQRRLDKLEALLTETTNELRESVPLLADLLSIPTSYRYPPLSLTPQKHKEKMLQALLARVECLATKQPVLMIWEDVHWSDPTSRELLDLTVDRVPFLPVLLIVTYRPGFSPPWVGRSHVILLTLNRLLPPQCAEMIASVTAGKALPKEVARRINDRADGVPLFIEELTKAVLESGALTDIGDHYAIALPLQPLVIPTSLNASLVARLSRLPPVREVAQIGASLGRQFSYELISSVAQMSQQQLDYALAQLEASELIFRRGVPPEAEYTFKHALVQDAAYSTLLRSRRRQLHSRIVGVLEAEFSDIVTNHPEFIAEHCAKSSVPEKAIGYWLSAARRAIGRSATTEAIMHLQKALQFLVSLPDSVSRQNYELNLLIALGQAQIASKGYAASDPTQTYARAREICERLGSPPQLVSVIDGQWSIATLQGHLTLAQQLAKKLLEFGEARSDTLGIVMGCQDCGDTGLLLGQYTAARDLSLRGLELCRSLERSTYAGIALEDPMVLMRANLAVALMYLGHLDQAREQIETAQAEALRFTQPVTVGWALFFSIRFQLAIHAYDVALRLLDDLLRQIHQRGIYLFGSSENIFRGQCLAALGDPQVGVDLIKDGLAAHHSSGVKMNLPTHLTSLAHAYGCAGQSKRGLRLLVKAEEYVEMTGERVDEAEIHRVRGDLLCALHDAAAAEASFRRAIAIAQGQSAKLSELIAVLSLSRLWYGQGKRAEARDLLVPIYNGFTEGFETPVLRDAKALLDDLA